MGANLLPCNAAVRLQARTTKHGSKRKAAQRVMAKVINFYVPNRFLSKVKWIPPQTRGKLIEFPVQVNKSA